MTRFDTSAGPRAGLVALALLCGCAGFDPTPPPAARLTFRLDLPAGAVARVKAYDENDLQVGTGLVTGSAAATLALAADQDFSSLRLVARSGERVLKALAVGVDRDDATDLGKVDAASTAATQLVQEKVAGQGGALSSVPGGTLKDLASQIAKGGADIKAFSDLVKTLVARSKTATREDPKAAAMFGDLDALLGGPFVALHAKDLPKTVAADYRNKLTAAVGRLTIALVCDAAFVKVMFSVDASGEAVDGNGAPQLIRQPTKSGHVYLAITVDDTSPVTDAAGALRSTMTPNDSQTAMFDDGTNGDEAAGDGVFTRVLALPRGMRVKYKYTNGSAGEGWTRTEEWPGNARLLEVRDVLSRNADGTPDCLVIRRDAFGDEASNKNNVNLHSAIKSSGGTLGFGTDLGGALAAKVAEGRYVGGLSLGDLRKKPPLTPRGVPEAMENGRCARCPSPLTMSTDDKVRPRLVTAEFTSTSRIKVSFSEAMAYASASLATNYLVLDGAQRALAISAVSASGSRVTLAVAAPDFNQTYTLRVKGLRDASANANAIAGGQAQAIVDPDRTAPQVLSVQPLPLRDFNPAATVKDPTVGQVVKITFDEEVERTSAENTNNYIIEGLVGQDLKVLSAHRVDRSQVWLVTSAQDKRLPYRLFASNVLDLASNPIKVARVKFDGYALYRVTFNAVPGFAFLDLAGAGRGLPKGEGLYLTGTILSVARDLSGDSLAVAGRTDVTGIPEYEMKPSKALYKGKAVYAVTVLAPPGVFAWKVAHGVAGEYKNPPATLVKVHKSLCTTADATGVNIDPVTLTALPLPGSDGKPISFLNYGKAKLSTTGAEAPGPFTLKSGSTLPAPTIMFKRENPDEVCTVGTGDVTCPGIVVGTWRDIAAFAAAGKSADYDDGLPEVAPVRMRIDLFSPRLLALTVRDSESLLLSFDERLLVTAANLSLSAAHAKKGTPLKVSVHTIGTIGSPLLPHQLLLRTGKMENGAAYTLTYNAVADVHGNKQQASRSQSWAAPQAFAPFTPLKDSAPPKVIAVLPKNPTSLLVQFNEKILTADGSNSSNFSILAASGVPPSVVSATTQGGGTAVLLSTGLQAAQATYTLSVKNIADLSSPPNVLTEQKIAFKGFGDFTPPKVVYAAAISPTEVAVAFDEALSPLGAQAATSYAVAGLTVASVAFSGDSTRRAAAFDSSSIFADNIVVLTTSKMTAGQTYKVVPAGVTDLSNNACKTTVTFKGVAAAPTVDLIITYKVSGSDTVAGKIPARAISAATLASQREGIFMLGSTVSTDGATKGAPTTALNKQLGAFPKEGQPLTGTEPQLLDSGQGGDAKAGDSVYTIKIKGVPLGTSILYKAFAPYTVSYKNSNPGDAQAAFADSAPGPSVFSDGQEYPGNENGIRVLGDLDGDGIVRINNLFGDESTFKKFTSSPPHVWVVDDTTWSK